MKRIKSAFFILSVSVLSFTVLTAQPANILLDNKEAFRGKQRPPVAFPHESHMFNFACTDCHHRYSGGKNIATEDMLVEGSGGIKCADCHTAGKKYDLMRAFHAQCMGCHGKMIKEGKKSGPRLCGECHPWK